ncbi:MAG: hypothetical protein ACRC0V_13045 [Fusobacteriaceae bacterium]
MNKTEKILNQKILEAQFPYVDKWLKPDLTLQNYANCKVFCELFEKTKLESDVIDFYKLKNNPHLAMDFKQLVELKKNNNIKEFKYFKELYLSSLNEYFTKLKNSKENIKSAEKFSKEKYFMQNECYCIGFDSLNSNYGFVKDSL